MKKIKMVVYGEPGTGKSVFACKAPKPFFICTDPNYEWLEDWGAKEEDHVQVFSWEQAKKEFAKEYKEYDTIVVDLTEDLFKWCEYEWCQKNNLQHVGDLGYGKGYDVTRNEFFIEISKLLNVDKNVILIMHGLTQIVKDRRGVEYTKYIPTNRLPDKVIDMIEGRVRYFIRAFAVTEEDENGNLVTNRYLSLSPDGTTEFGITRGLSGDIPRYIPLEWDTFYALVTKNSSNGMLAKKTEPKKEETKVEKQTEEPKKTVKKTVKKEVSELEKLAGTDEEETVEETVEEEKVEEPIKEEPKKEEPKKEEPVQKPQQPVNNEDKIAAIKARLAALKGNK